MGEGIFYGLMMGILLYISMAAAVPNSIYNQHHKAIDACEKDLPRSEHCVIIAVPRSKD
jgi:hypothetical protein